jgi:hypothetical protein
MLMKAKQHVDLPEDVIWADFHALPAGLAKVPVELNELGLCALSMSASSMVGCHTLLLHTVMDTRRSFAHTVPVDCGESMNSSAGILHFLRYQQTGQRSSFASQIDAIIPYLLKSLRFEHLDRSGPQHVSKIPNTILHKYDPNVFALQRLAGVGPTTGLSDARRFVGRRRDACFIHWGYL